MAHQSLRSGPVCHAERRQHSPGSPSSTTTPAQSSRWRSARTARPWPPPLAAPTASAMARVCSCGTWRPTSRSAAHSPTRRNSAVDSVAFSPDGKTLATGNSDDTVHLWDVAHSPADQRALTATGPVDSVAFSPDGKTLATGTIGSTPPTAWCDCVTWPPTSRSAPLSPCPAVRARSIGGIQPRRQDPGHRQLRRRRGCGTWPPTSRSAPLSPCPAVRARSIPWRSAQTARPWPPAATMARRGCGT